MTLRILKELRAKFAELYWLGLRFGFHCLRKAFLFFTNYSKLHGHSGMTIYDWRVESQYTYQASRSGVGRQQNEQIDQQIERLKQKPVFSIVVPCLELQNVFIKHCVTSVLNQLYPYWELLLMEEKSSDFSNLPYEINKLAEIDNRIRVVPVEETAEAANIYNTALPLAKGEFIIFLEVFDEISPDALYEVASLINKYPDADLIYTDEDKIDMCGRRSLPNFKPGWSPELLHSTMYLGQLTVYRRNFVDTLGIRPDYNGAWAYDLALRASDTTQRIFHIPKILAHRFIGSILPKPFNMGALEDSDRGLPDLRIQKIHVDLAIRKYRQTITSKDYFRSQKRALESYLLRNHLEGTIKETNVRNAWHILFKVFNPQPLVSIIIPSAGKTAIIRGKTIEMLSNCLKSIRDKTTYTNYEIIIIHNKELPRDTLDFCDSIPCLRRVFFPRPTFNFSETINKGAEEARGDFLLLLNDDTEVISPDWLTTMVGLGSVNGVGAVGAKLLMEDRANQHIGVTLLKTGPHHAFYLSWEHFPGPGHINLLTHNCIAVTAACLMVKKQLFNEVGGFDTALGLNYNDIDFCLRIVQAGHRIALDPAACLYHFESITKSSTCFKELELFLLRWGMINDPYYNPNYDLEAPTFKPPMGDGIWSTLKRDKNHAGWMANRLTTRRKIYRNASDKQLFSFLTPTYNTSLPFLKDLEKSVLKQTYPHLEWVIVDNGSKTETVAYLKEIAKDPRVKLILNEENMGIVKATRQALENATGTYVIALDHDDLLYLDSLEIIACYLDKHPNTELFYSDEDKFNDCDLVDTPYFKPDWDPVLLNGCCYVAHLSGIKRDLALKCGAYTDPLSEGTQDWDMHLRANRSGAEALHIPEILYSWRKHADSTASSGEAKPYTSNAQQHILSNHIRLLEKEGAFEIKPNPLVPVYWRLHRKPVNAVPVHVILVSENNFEKFKSALHALALTTNYPQLSIYLSGSIDNEKRQEIDQVTQLTLQHGLTRNIQILDGNNLKKQILQTIDITVGKKDHGFVTLTSDFSTITTPDWAWESIGLLEFFTDAVVVGGKILNEQGKILYGSGYFDVNGQMGSPEANLLAHEFGYFSNNLLQKTVEGVSPLHWTADAGFLREVLTQEVDSVSLNQLAFALALAAMESKKRIICSPFINSLIINKDRHLPLLPINRSETSAYRDRATFKTRRRYYHSFFSRSLELAYRPTWEPEELP